MSILISLFILSAIIVPIALYKRSKSLRFRLIETRLENANTYTPQVRISGAWFNVVRGENKFYLSIYYFDEFLEDSDAMKHIYEFQIQKNYTVPSNIKLTNNQKSIKVE